MKTRIYATPAVKGLSKHVGAMIWPANLLSSFSLSLKTVCFNHEHIFVNREHMFVNREHRFINRQH